MLFESVLGRVVCATSLVSNNEILTPCGYMAARHASDLFEFVSGGPAVLVDPVVERDFLAIAFVHLEVAQASGRVPPFFFFDKRGPHAEIGS
jgi:hypothetical protein